jgi:hypothetical protein
MNFGRTKILGKKEPFLVENEKCFCSSSCGAFVDQGAAANHTWYRQRGFTGKEKSKELPWLPVLA